MNRKIFVIHSSEIIRKGINTILRAYFNIEIILLERIEELIGFFELEGYDIVIIYEHENNQKTSKIFNHIQKNNRVRWIAYLNDEAEASEPLPFCKFYITADTLSSQLQQMVLRCWDKTRRRPRQTENEELSVREKEVLKLVALGYSNKVIAEKLFISIHTVISHRKNITEKTGIKSISGLTVYAILNNLIDTDTINPEDLI